MLTPDEVIDVVRDLWKRHEDERVEHDQSYDFARGKRGVPPIPDGAGEELEDLAKLSVKNVIGPVVDAFAQSLAVHGFRDPHSASDDPVWEWWQQQRLDARQSEVHRPAVTYGAAYAIVSADSCRLRTPRQLFAAYEDPSADLWPRYALDTWLDMSEAKPVRRAALYDGEWRYPVTLGTVSRRRIDGEERGRRPIRPEYDEGDAERHGASVCPVVRFVNARDAEDVVLGEVSPLIRKQRAINAVNFDRLCVSRFGAFRQKYVIGWSATAEQVARASAARIMNFEDGPEEIRVGDFGASSVEPYNSILQEMVADVATSAQVPLYSFGSIVNLSAEALAMAEAPHQRKLRDKRESFGESWEQVLRLAGELAGFEVSDGAEVVWQETEVRSFAQVVDGIVKLAGAGVEVSHMLEDIPGWTKQRVDAVKAELASAPETPRST